MKMGEKTNIEWFTALLAIVLVSASATVSIWAVLNPDGGKMGPESGGHQRILVPGYNYVRVGHSGFRAAAFLAG